MKKILRRRKRTQERRRETKAGVFRVANLEIATRIWDLIARQLFPRSLEAVGSGKPTVARPMPQGFSSRGVCSSEQTVQRRGISHEGKKKTKVRMERKRRTALAAENSGYLRCRRSSGSSLARSRGIHFGRAEATRRHRAASLQKHAINYPGIAASTIPSMLHKW